MVRVLFFGRLSEIAGIAETAVELPSGKMDIKTFCGLIAGGNSELAKALAKPSVRVAINQEIVLSGAMLGHGDEVAFLPPVSGG